MIITFQLALILRVIKLILHGADHRSLVTDLIDEIFVNETMVFFKKIVDAKSNGHQIDKNWYSKHFLNEILNKNDIAWNSGTNLKTVSNRRGSTNKWIVLDEAHKQFKQFSDLVDSYSNDELNLSLRISNGQKPVVLDFNESFIVINAIAVRRAGIRGGAWSSLGKQVEGPLMTVLCMLHDLDTNRYRRHSKNNDPFREVDFYLIKPDGNESKCEVKLMGKGNPESADAVVARESKVFVS